MPMFRMLSHHAQDELLARWAETLPGTKKDSGGATLPGLRPSLGERTPLRGSHPLIAIFLISHSRRAMPGSVEGSIRFPWKHSVRRFLRRRRHLQWNVSSPCQEGHIRITGTPCAGYGHRVSRTTIAYPHGHFCKSWRNKQLNSFSERRCKAPGTSFASRGRSIEKAQWPCAARFSADSTGYRRAERHEDVD